MLEIKERGIGKLQGQTERNSYFKLLQNSFQMKKRAAYISVRFFLL